jgi:hypothetical protein
MNDTMIWRSFKVGVRNKKSEQWVYNGLRFHSEENAQAYADDLSRRWTWVREAAVHQSEDEPNAVFPVPDSTYQVPRIDRLQFKPRDIDIMWARQMVATLKEGGTMMYPATELVYQIHHSTRTIVLMNPDQLIYVQSLIVHLRTVATFEVINWKVIQKEEDETYDS